MILDAVNKYIRIYLYSAGQIVKRKTKNHRNHQKQNLRCYLCSLEDPTENRPPSSLAREQHINYSSLN